MIIDEAIINPGNAHHFMRIKPITRMITVTRGLTLLAASDRAVRVLEVGRDLYDPVVYLPMDDLKSSLVPVPGKSTHCPLKGDASYFALSDQSLDNPLAWTYDRPLDIAAALSALIAFYPDHVTITEAGSKV